jgi:hypothetical protein
MGLIIVNLFAKVSESRFAAEREIYILIFILNIDLYCGK